jgi:hypothetical protein
MKSANWTATILIGIATSLAFFLFFAFAVESITFFALRICGPAIRWASHSLGHAYAQALGYAIAFVIGSLAAFAFVYPITFLVRDWLKLTFVILAAVLPVSFFLTLGSGQSAFGISIVMQPVAGALIAAALRPNNSFKPKPLRGSA